MPYAAHHAPFLDRLKAWSQEHEIKPQVLAQSDSGKGSPLKLSVMGPIGSFYFESITDKQVARALDEHDPSEIDLSINSPGGDAFMGTAIYNLLKSHPAHVTVRVLGEAASAAGIISQAGDRVIMGTGSMLMVHNAWSITMGSWRDHRASINLLRKADQSQLDILTSRSNLTRERLSTMLDRETWITADEAIQWGLADERADGTSQAPTPAEQDLPDPPADPAPAALASKRVLTSLDREGLRPIGSLFHL